MQGTWVVEANLCQIHYSVLIRNKIRSFYSFKGGSVSFLNNEVRGKIIRGSMEGADVEGGVKEEK